MRTPNFIDDDLSNVPRTSSNFPMPDLVEVDSSDDKDSDDEDDNDDVGNPITGVPVTTNTPTRNMSPVLASNRPSANTPPRSGLPVVTRTRPAANTPPDAPPTSTTRTKPRESKLLVPTAIPSRTYAAAVLFEDVNEVEEAADEEEIVPPAVPLLQQPLLRTGKRTRTQQQKYNVGHKNVPKYQYGHNHLQTDPKMRPMPKKFEYGSIHLQTSGIVIDMDALTAASSDTCNLLPMTEQDCNDHIMGVVMTQYSLKQGLKELGERGEKDFVRAQQSQGYEHLLPYERH